MTLQDAGLLAFCVVALIAITKPLGRSMMAVCEGRRTWLHPVLRPGERGIYRAAGVNEDTEQGWRRYLLTLLGFNLAGRLLLYLILRTQSWLPLNPQDLSNVKPS